MQDPDLFGEWFSKKGLRGNTWKTWTVFLRALFGLGLDDEARETYCRFTGRDDVPTEQANEGWLVCGRRSGKSLIAAFIAVFLACFRDYTEILALGEVGTIMILASDKRQARTVLGYVFGFFDSIPMLAPMVYSRTRESITLTNRVRIEVHTASFRAVRGYTVVAAILDEIAFFATGDVANPDQEIVTALRPAMATVPNALLLGISSPYARRGVLWDAFREHYGKARTRALVWKAATREMNETVSPETIALAYATDASAASAEYGGEFRTDIESFISLEIVEACTRDRREIPPIAGLSYHAFCDPSGGASDSFSLAIGHWEKSIAVLDVLQEAPAPFSPEKVVAEFCDTLKKYRVSSVIGDRYAGAWPREQFAKRFITYKTSDLTRSEIYLEVLPALTSGQVELLNNPRLKAQLTGLERRTARSGRDSIDHPPGGRDDLSNSAAGVLTEILRVNSSGAQLGLVNYYKGIVTGTIPDPTIAKPVARETVAMYDRAEAWKVKTPPCEACGSACTVAISGAVHCNQCGQDTSPNRKPQSKEAQRSNILTGRIRARFLGQGREGRDC